MSTLSVGTIRSNTSAPPVVQNTSGTEIGTFCRAWVNFNGVGTVAIRASFNVSSITDNNTGDYTVNFTTAMPDVNYSAVASATDTGNPLTALNAVAVVGTKATSSIRAVLRTVSGAVTYFDANTYDVSVFR
jgi:hypothetical protein